MPQTGSSPQAGLAAAVSAPPASAAPAPPKAGNRAVLPAVIAVVLIGLLAYGGFLFYSGYFNRAKTPVAEAPKVAEQKTEQDSRAGDSLTGSIALEDIRQFLVDNVEVGKIMVIQGFAVNKSHTGKDYITIEARVLDEHNAVLVKTRELCGVPLTLFQLQTLTEKELKETLGNRTTILVNNTNVTKGGRVPFVVVFPNPPAGMRTFEVQVVDARESPPA
jgi:hypothetical protein